MKKLLWTTFSLVLGLSLALFFIGLTAPSAQAAIHQAGGVDPEPEINLPRTGTGETPEAILATLEPAWTSPTSDFTNQLAWGDYDQDGDLDLLVGNSGENRLYQNDGNPTTPTLTEVDTLVCQNPASDTTQSIDWGDYDMDGDLDIVIGNSNNRNCVLQNNNGSFDLAWLADVILDTRSVAFAGWEYNNEFNMYLAVGNGSEPTNVYRFEGGTFDLWWTETTVYATNVVAWGDYDNDGDPDLVLGNFGQPNRLYRNDLNTLTYLTDLPGTLNTRDLAWGDMNGDGYLDLAQGNGQSLGNSNTARVYCNSGSPAFTFSECWESAEAVSTFNVAWGDYEGDGDLDLALSSEENGTTRIYQNNGAMLGATPIWDADDDTANSRAVSWADWNGDGDLEFVIGYFGGATLLYENTAGVFQSTSFGPDTYDARSAAWGDYDSDGDFDLAVGNSSSAPSLVYENTNGTLALAFSAPFAENTRSVAWGDYDGDGDLDLALGNGAAGTGQANRLYRNDGGTLVNSLSFFDPFPSNTYAVAWGDFDGDGDLDLALAGLGASGRAHQVWRNDAGKFTLIEAGFNTGAPVAWSDFDRDGDLDLLTGAQLWRNEGASANAPPAMPAALNHSASGNRVTFAWNAASDDHTPSPGLSYRLRVETASLPPGATPLSLTTVQRSTRTHLDLPDGIYYWTVQTLDSAEVGSSWAPETRIVLSPDADADGLPDVWELCHALNPSASADATVDSDGDGISNVDEFIANTDARDPASLLTILAV
ncbi:MAG: VCBS repeat-containing protein, partial [Anaerolineales bacterium]|nr:VCBS repeat-containing protein [Anaerolineales bacterium]